jgi:hypothetical protein
MMQKDLHMVYIRTFMSCIFLLLLAACSSNAAQGTDSAGTNTPTPVPQATASEAGERAMSHPDAMQLLADLRQRGLEPTEPDVSRVEWLRAAPGLAYRLGAGWLHVHAYPDVEAAEANVAQIPPSADTGMTDWVAAPHFFRCNAVIALYLGSDEHVTQALTELCGPQFAGFN